MHSFGIGITEVSFISNNENHLPVLIKKVKPSILPEFPKFM